MFDLSIVIVSYNTIKLTQSCLQSVVDNCLNISVQIIVVDNNSSDGSVEMIKHNFPQVVLVENDCNKGFGPANNQAFPLCDAEYILLLNSDTVVLGNVFENTIKVMKTRQDIGALGCQVLNPDGTTQPTCSGYPSLLRLLLLTLSFDRIPILSAYDSYLMRHWQRDNEKEVEVISGCYLLFRRSILSRVGEFDERFFFFGEETDWCKRIRNTGWKLLFSPVGQIIHYGGGSIKKLKYKRDVQLTAALVDLHRKYGRFPGAATAYCILMLFNLSRAIFWLLLSTIDKDNTARSRHFFKVLFSFKKCWSTGSFND